MVCTHPHRIRDRHLHQPTRNPKCHDNDPDCPHPQARGEIEFREQPMVDWLAPPQLAATGMKTMTAHTFGAYADKREMQAALAVPRLGVTYDVDFDYTTEEGKPVEELWFDYIADLGDGFAPTYTMARLLGNDIQIGEDVLPAGRFAVLGGDQVYPHASRLEYENRFLGPFQAALPWRRDARHIYALPGNHDWYDGLTSFLRIFCQTRIPGDGGRWIGAWRTQQRRSYFALRLPHDWWIWGIDLQLESDLDRPQLEYFERLAKAMVDEAKANDRAPSFHKIILMTAEPNWVFCGDEAAQTKRCPIKPDDFNALMWFENRVIRAKGFSLPLVIAGDLHHYVRYTSTDGKTHRITSGGGGAYLMGTHQMPEAIALPEGTTETMAEQMTRRAYDRRACYPATEVSEKLTDGVRGLALRNRKFALLLGTVYASLALLLALGSHVLAVVLAVLVVAASRGYTKANVERQPLLRGYEGMLHGVAHVLVALLAWIAAMQLPLRLWGDAGLTMKAAIIAGGAFAAFLIGYFGGSWLFAYYLSSSSRRTGAHTEELFSSMAIEDYKSFLRMHIDRDGALRVHAIGVDRVPTDYVFHPPGPNDCGAPWFRSASGAAVEPRIVDTLG